MENWTLPTTMTTKEKEGEKKDTKKEKQKEKPLAQKLAHVHPNPKEEKKKTPRMYRSHISRVYIQRCNRFRFAAKNDDWIIKREKEEE